MKKILTATVSIASVLLGLSSKAVAEGASTPAEEALDTQSADQDEQILFKSLQDNIEPNYLENHPDHTKFSHNGT